MVKGLHPAPGSASLKEPHPASRGTTTMTLDTPPPSAGNPGSRPRPIAGAAARPAAGAPATADAELVVRILAGDRAAVGELYDRYADRIHTMASHMLRDPDEAADVTGQVFLVAMERIHQLRDPDKVGPWLFAIARNEVRRRGRHRSRVRPVEELDDMDVLTTDRLGLDDLEGAAAADRAAESALLAGLVQEAAAGLDDRDRMVLELNLTQGIDGDDLAAALGVSVDNAYQLTHRMKERFERSLSALLVVRAGRDQCADLDGVAAKWDGTYDVLWRKRFARHVDRCDRCTGLRSKLPKAMLAGAALSLAAQSAAMAAPISIRERVVEQAASAVGTSTEAPWSADGFPVERPRRHRWPRIGAACVLVVILVLGVAAGLGGGLKPDSADGVDTTETTTTQATSTTGLPTSSSAPGDTAAPTTSPVTLRPPTTAPPATRPPTTTAPTTAPVTTAAPTTTVMTTAPTTAPPTTTVPGRGTTPPVVTQPPVLAPPTRGVPTTTTVVIP